MAPKRHTEQVTIESLQKSLAHTSKVKIAGIDVDGVLRGKLIAKDKFLSMAEDGSGFCSVIFGWDMHDQTYTQELKISNKENGYHDILAKPDLNSFRTIPWEHDVPFFLVSFLDPDTKNPVCACPRGLLRQAAEKVERRGLKAMAGAEYEFYQFRAPQSHEGPLSERDSSSTARHLLSHSAHSLEPITEGMTGYSLVRPVANQDYYYAIFDTCAQFRCGIEGWHTESGPGVFEAALEYDEIKEMADKASLFKYTVKCIASKYGITPCFMAKPRSGLPGSSGHMHVSIVDQKTGRNLFHRESRDAEAPFPDVEYMSDFGRCFLAGVLEGLADVLPLLAPTVNSYKRLVENFWAPVTVSWGLEHRAAAVRVIAPPVAPPQATRLEVRVPGADANPHFVLAAILALGWRGVEKKLDIPIPPLGKGEDVGSQGDQGQRLAKTLVDATQRFMRPDSIAREVFGDDFVDHYGGTRLHEIRLWNEAVTDWEVKRYIEMV